ncbi:hypothetical protein ABIE89_005755 [Bradyrhizobium niftali]|uniref:hypothetical protein n=1 Tax=Bradyrhizobium niftali TaxID=2560055 RepID=UPI003832C5DB
MSFDLTDWREMGATLTLTVLNKLLALMLIFFGVLMMIAISLDARRRRHSSELSRTGRAE